VFSLTYEGFDAQAEGLREVLTSTSNGRFCTRGAAEWEDADGVHYPGTYAHGIYNRETTILGGVPVRNEDLVNLPNSSCSSSGSRAGTPCDSPTWRCLTIATSSTRVGQL
jgi:trehalose/maltose hydrolase-like predicted phosphorylase